MGISTIASALVAAAGSAAAVSIAEINGNRFLSPLVNSSVTDVEGLVTAISQDGAFLRSTKPDDDDATSDSVFLYAKNMTDKVAVGDIVTLDGRVVEYR